MASKTDKTDKLFVRIEFSFNNWKGFDEEAIKNKDTLPLQDWIKEQGWAAEWWNFYDFPGDFYYGNYGGNLTKNLNKFINGGLVALAAYTQTDASGKTLEFSGFYDDVEYRPNDGSQFIPETWDTTINNSLPVISRYVTPERIEEIRKLTFCFRAKKENSVVFIRRIPFIPTKNYPNLKDWLQSPFCYIGDGPTQKLDTAGTKWLFEQALEEHKKLLSDPEYSGRKPEIEQIIQKIERATKKYFSAVNSRNPHETIIPTRGPTMAQKFPKQTILYGPPGTGKTYSAFLRAHEILFDERVDHATFTSIRDRLLESESKDIDLSDLTWLDAIILAFKETTKDRASVPELKSTEILKKYVSFKKREKNVHQTIWATLQQNSVIDSKTVKLPNKNGKELFDKDESSVWYLTSQGKEYLADKLDELQSNPSTTIYQLTFVTFHQSFSYEDFIEGYRPELTAESGSNTVSYALHEGIFKKLCTHAANDPDHPYVLIIDEINRGNISKIFGELITLIESNKRIGGKEEIRVNLPYSGDEFGVPQNVYVIGTMNSTDKSIALVDIALRRRFKFEKIQSTPKLIENITARTLLERLNENICALKNSDFVIGHSYFMGIPVTDENNAKLEEVFINQVLPLLEEYFYNDWESLATLLGKDSVVISESISKLVWNEVNGKFESIVSDDEKIYGRKLNTPPEIFKNTLSNFKITSFGNQ